MTADKKMQDIIESNGAGALLQSTQQLRTHWSGVIDTRIGYIIVADVAIWSYFLKAYIDSLATPPEVQPLYILLATTLSAILLGVWRLDTYHIDNGITSLYADFVLCEGVLSVPPEHGTSGYLIRSIGNNLRLILEEKNLTPKERAKGILMLFERKRIGGRGNLETDRLTLFILLGMCAVSIPLQTELLSYLTVSCYSGIIIGFVLIWFGWRTSQKNPSEGDIKDILSELKGNRGTGA